VNVGNFGVGRKSRLYRLLTKHTKATNKTMPTFHHSLHANRDRPSAENGRTFPLEFLKPFNCKEEVGTPLDQLLPPFSPLSPLTDWEALQK
jgi:hypothetical protein